MKALMVSTHSYKRLTWREKRKLRKHARSIGAKLMPSPVCPMGFMYLLDPEHVVVGPAPGLSFGPVERQWRLFSEVYVNTGKPATGRITDITDA